jgi:hypothetical protein
MCVRVLEYISILISALILSCSHFAQVVFHGLQACLDSILRARTMQR